MLSIHNLLRWKLAGVCGKITTWRPPTFLTHDSAENNSFSSGPKPFSGHIYSGSDAQRTDDNKHKHVLG